MTTILFFELDDFVRELDTAAKAAGPRPTAPVVRLEGLFKAEQSENTPALVITSAEVHVRTETAGGDVLVWMREIGEVRVIRSHEKKGPTEAERDLTVNLDKIREAISGYLESLGLDVRRGLIDISPATPVAGTWAGLDDGIKVAATGDRQTPAEGGGR